MQYSNGDNVRILALVGSFRSGSFNQALIRATRELAPEHVRIGDLDLSLPFNPERQSDERNDRRERSRYPVLEAQAAFFTAG